jgi:hypothetical protein
VQLDDHDQPVIVDGKLLLRDEAAGWAPPINSTEYRVVLRDAYLLSRGYLAAHTDGRTQMADHSEHQTGGRSGHAAPGPYPDPRNQRDQVDRDILELSQAGFDGDLEAGTICPGGSRGSVDVSSEEVPARAA